MKFSIHQETRQGARHSNQDRIGYMYTAESILMVVCDGMGGHHRGEVAAQFVVEFMAKAFRQTALPKLKDSGIFLRKAILAAHNALLRYAEAEKMTEVPRTTCVAVVIQDGKMAWAHVGDSRIYHMRDGALVKRTIDHSQVQMMIDKGEITEQEAEVHKDRNKIFNCMGQPTPPRIDVSKAMSLKEGDSVLLATDGLWGPVPTSMMGRALTKMDLKVALPWLLDLSETYSGRECDNLSAVVLKWYGEDRINIPSAPAVPNTSSALEKIEAQNALDDEMMEITIEAIRTASNKRANRLTENG